jgi:succinate dehydrogenase/fumarate reductase iron-sulfur protein
MLMSIENACVKIYRYDPKNGVSKYETYWVPYIKNLKILDVLLYIQRSMDGTISFRYDCRGHQRCGTCGVLMNGKPVLACKKSIEKYMIIEPLPIFRVIKDLVVDRDSLFKPLTRIPLFVQRFSVPKMEPEAIDLTGLEDHMKLIECVNCGLCFSTCPAVRAHVEPIGVPVSMGWLATLTTDPRDEGERCVAALQEGLYNCVMCRHCQEVCPHEIDIPMLAIAKLRAIAVEKGILTQSLRIFLNNISKHGNPWGFARSKRDPWMGRIKRYQTSDEYLLYMGCLCSYEERGKSMAEALVELLEMAGISFGILGNEEDCCGNEAYMVGETGLFQELAYRNTEKFKQFGVKKIVTLSPHAYNIMKNEYSRFGDFEVLHYTNLLSEIIQEKRINLSEQKIKVTYHDPCFLGRYNGIYDKPREVLKSIPGIELIEMNRNRENSLCCGGGSGNFVTDTLGGREKSPNRTRVKEAYETGADILVVACPICKIMLDDGIKDEELEGELIVKDIAELVKQSVRVGRL